MMGRESSLHTELLPKLAFCLVMHSSYNSGDHGEKVIGSFAMRSSAAAGAISVAMLLYKSLSVGFFDLRNPVTR